MINRLKTIKDFGYDPDELSGGSHKLIYVICKNCKKERLVRYQQYRSLCRSCANSGKKNGFYGKNHSSESKNQMSNKRLSMIGELNPNWHGGLSYGKYCSKFNNQLKQSVRDHYNNCDYISGIHKDICNSNQELSVHHVNYDKQCGCNGNKCKLIPLSLSNHIKTNFNRFFWNKLFKYSLEIDEWYYEGVN